jgi:hypothetical protein
MSSDVCRLKAASSRQPLESFAFTFALRRASSCTFFDDDDFDALGGSARSMYGRPRTRTMRLDDDDDDDDDMRRRKMTNQIH